MRTRILWLVAAAGILQTACDVQVRFDPAAPDIGPFPTDALTTPDPAQKTGLRINMPLPDCGEPPSTRAELALVNQLDGFCLNPRIRARFSDAVNPDTLRDGIFILWLDDLTNEESGLNPSGAVTRINTVMYDPATNTAYAEPDQILSQRRRYALIVTDAVIDGSPAAEAIASAAQRQIAEFLAGGGLDVQDVNYLVRALFEKDLFGTPSVLPWDLNY